MAPKGTRLQNKLICFVYVKQSDFNQYHYVVLITGGEYQGIFIFTASRGPQWRTTTKYANLLQFMFSILLLTSSTNRMILTGRKYQGIFIFTASRGPQWHTTTKYA